MRAALRLLLLAGIAPALLVGAGAYNAARTDARAIAVAVVSDSDAYLSVAANGAHAYDCVVSEAAGKLAITLGALDAGCASAGAGAGINAGDGADAAKRSRYAFHDLLVVTNKGTRALDLWVNATVDANGAGATIEAAKEATTGQMTDADYAASTATPLALAVGGVAYVGVRVDSGTTTAGTDVTGTLTLTARSA